MLKKLWLAVVMAGMVGGCSLIPRKAGLEVLGYPSAKVYLDGKEVGMTPYKSTTLLPGRVSVRLVNGTDEWQKDIPLVNNANTIVNWEFGSGKTKGGGYVLYVEATGDKARAELLVNSKPEKAAVAIDGEIKALSPVVIPDLGEGDKQVTISFPSFKTINLFVKSLKGYQLVLEAELQENEVIKEEGPQVLPTPTAVGPTVKIRETETGWLRVREEPSNASAEVGKVNPGESYALLEEQNGWYKIALGWISAKYADKVE